MQILCDTNILLRAAKTDHSDHQVVLDSLAVLHGSSRLPVMVPQNIYEYYVVATRPLQQNGLGLDSNEALRDVNRLSSIFRLLRDERTVFDRWVTLVQTHSVLGKQSHDTRLVAAMAKHGITTILTYNVRDFRRYTGFTVLTPADVLNS